MRRSAPALAVLGLGLAGCPRGAPPSPADGAALVARPAKSLSREPAVVLYDGGLENGWQDWGWTAKEMPKGAPAVVNFDNFGGWILAKPGLTGDYGGVVFRVKEPPGEGEFIEVHLQSPAGATLAKVPVSPDDRTDVGEGWTEVFIPLDRLDPDQAPFDRVVIQAFRKMEHASIPIDKIALTKASPRPTAAAYDPSALRQVRLSLDCRAKARKISPLIWGVAYYAFDDAAKQEAQWQLGATARRWGGNTTSTYNWEISAWNTGNDWFFENNSVPSYATFLKDNAAHGMKSALTIPILGWVSKDTTSSSFPVSAFGPQQAVDQWRPDAGNGKDKSGKPLAPGSPPRAYEPITPAYVKRWITAIRAEDAKTGRRSVDMYILGNEPMLWSTTHRDAHPEPLGYDELLQRTIDFGTAVREADPDAVIAGPAEWGWTGYMYSGKDMASGGPSARPDRRAHGDLPVVAYYLKALAEHEKKTGVRVLDVLDLHGYPYADGVGGDGADAKTAALRIRTTRMLWDPDYTDESWVKEPVNLLPRMRGWIDENYPGRGISIGEWSFGGQGHMSGALATAEAFGRYAQYGVTSAFFWTYPAAGSPSSWAFRAYRNYDARGDHFLDWFTPITAPSGAWSAFGSRDETGKHLVVVALNLSHDDAVTADLDVSSCGKLAAIQSYTYQGGEAGFVAAPAPGGKRVLPPYSITVLDAQLDDPSPLVR